MELSHKSHEHPLFFVDGGSETDELVRCFACGKDICRGRYSCFPCQFHLHKSCTELPPLLEHHPLHPQHTLALLLRSPYTQGYDCDACSTDADSGFIYRCTRCYFKCHPMCAVVQKGSIFSEGIGDQHVLMLKEEQSDDKDYCFVCSESVSASFFSCSRSRCTFRLHKSCADLPLTLHNNSFHHPQHPLLLVSQSTGICQLCGQVNDSSAYYYICWTCGFSIHPRCALSDPIHNIKRMGEKQVQHFTHQHLLTLLQNQGEYTEIEKRIRDEGNLAWRRDKIPLCHLCRKQVASFPSSYGCQSCPFILHKSCAELPAQIKTHFHPDHFLFLFARPSGGKPPMTDCDLCGTEINDSNYRCVQCGFKLHVDCFLSLRASEKLYDHKHCFINLENFMKLTCQTCGEEGHFSPWQCSFCRIMVHSKCVDLPRILKLEPHHHNLKLTYYLSSLHPCAEMTCKLCHGKVKVDYAAYYCSKCNYAAHLNCAKQIGKSVSEEENIVEGISNSLVEGNKSGVIQHFSHQQHELTLVEQDPEDHKYCEGCVTLIFLPFYSCNECNFYLHKKCGDSPRTKKHPFHDHPLTLVAVDRPYTCHKCGNRSNGFMYGCQTPYCTYNLDLQCADTFSEGLQHPCHEHPLFFPYTSRRYERCRGCCETQKHIMICSKCDDYALGYCCLRIPHVAKHRYDDHLLILSYKMEDESGEYYCDICEEERDPETWFYSCSQCKFYAHIDCTIGEFPHWKYGTTWEFPSHDHPFTLVEKCERNPPPLCDSCGKHCYSRLFECCQCNIHFHFSRFCLERDH